jgi:hypothetical protein
VLYIAAEAEDGELGVGGRRSSRLRESSLSGALIVVKIVILRLYEPN